MCINKCSCSKEDSENKEVSFTVSEIRKMIHTILDKIESYNETSGSLSVDGLYNLLGELEKYSPVTNKKTPKL